MFRHHAWATLTLLDFCAGLPAAQLSETAPGTYGAVLPALQHLVSADQRYLWLITREEGNPRIHESLTLTLAELRAGMEAQTKRWEAILDRVDELDVTIPARGESPETPHATNLLLLQAIQHGNDHRTQACTVLSVLGVEPPELDGWNYWGATRG